MRRLLPTILLAACGGSAPAPRVTPPPSPPPPLQPEGPPVSLCDGRAGCTEAEWYDAGRDADGRPLAVVKLALPRDEDECDPFEYWAVIGPRQHPITTQLLIADCNDGYGAAGVGEDAVEVTPNRFRHVRNGGSSWRWTSEAMVQLSPLAIVETAGDGMWTLGENSGASNWSWPDFRGSSEGTAVTCNADGEPDGTLDYRRTEIPVPSLPADFVDGGWETTGLGACAATIDSAGQRGFVIHGQPGTADDARLKVVGGPDDTLFVEIYDDVWRTAGKSWVVDDHLEIWLGDEPIDWSEQCVDPAALPKPAQWGIRISDGEVFAAYGKPTVPVAVDLVPATGGGPTRLKLALPHNYKSITVVYSDSDDGAHQERLIATSAFTFGKAATLGDLHPIDPAEAVCERAGGALAPRPTRTFTRDQAAITGM